MKILQRTQFGNPILRETAERLSKQEVISPKIQQLINNMRYTLTEEKLGVGLAAPQVDKSLALVVIAIRPSELRPKVKPFDLVLINPEVIKTPGLRTQVWEGCISAGSNGKADLFAKVPRYKEIKIKYLDENAKPHTKTFTGLRAQIIQHETDHLNGTLFVDHVKDTKTYMTYKEYLKVKKSKLI